MGDGQGVRAGGLDRLVARPAIGRFLRALFTILPPVPILDVDRVPLMFVRERQRCVAL